MSQKAPKRRKPKISLRVKIFIAFIIVGFPPVSITLLSGFVIGMGLREASVGARFESMAVWLAEGIESSFSDEILEAHSLALAPILLDAVADANMSYAGRDQKEIEEEINAFDVEWRNAPKINEKIRGYLSTPVSKYLQSILDLRSDKYAEIFVTDEQGALVGSTGKTTDFYQADEEWWEKAFNRGNGRNIIQGVEFDESTQRETITVAVPVRDQASHTVVGVLKVVMKTEYLFRSINSLHVDEEGGYAALTNRKRDLLTTSAPEPPVRVPVNFWETIVSRGKGSAKALGEMDEEHIVGFAAVETDSIDGEVLLTGGKWYVYFYESSEGTYERIYSMTYLVLSLGLGLALFLSVLGYIAASRVVRPIRLLREEAQYIARGDLGRKIEVKSNDEIELLAEDINMMSEKLKEVHSELEERIEDRTSELSEANKRLEAQRGVLLKVNKQLMKASTLKSEFLADICDGLNNPVHNIISLAENVLNKGVDQLDEMQQAYLGDVLSNAKHLHQLISEVFTLARATSGKMELTVSTLDVEKALRDVQETVKALATEKNIQFEFAIDDTVGEFEADVNLFKHVVFNLYTNAIKYGRINGKVTIASAMVDDALEVSVTDTGIGIRPEDQERIFYEFEKIESAQTPYYEGSGMGLALAQRFVEMHGGKIWVESQHGKGSTFVFRIPMSQGKR
jgi:signal transduction histidine kinase